MEWRATGTRVSGSTDLLVLFCLKKMEINVTRCIGDSSGNALVRTDFDGRLICVGRVKQTIVSLDKICFYQMRHYLFAGPI